MAKAPSPSLYSPVKKVGAAANVYAVSPNFGKPVSLGKIHTPQAMPKKGKSK